jgi:hypothetical protein
MQNIGLAGVSQGGRKVISQPASHPNDRSGSGAVMPAASADGPLLPQLQAFRCAAANRRSGLPDSCTAKELLNNMICAVTREEVAPQRKAAFPFFCPIKKLPSFPTPEQSHQG